MKAVVVVFALLAVACVLAGPGKGKTDRCHGKKDGTRFVDTKDCHKYVQCTGGKEKSMSCSHSQNFDAESLKCMTKSTAKCYSADETDVPTEAPTPTCNTPFSADCTKYWACEDGEPALKDCLEGYFYYEPLHSCLPGDVQSCELYSLNTA
ncbi:AAEL009598-PA [Aedes aegypti]|uniref:AAEL009598-PA n=1 Tax=Aedes aegypti TaxID=7159 RepID=Q16VE4_AEDAE|nr:AAEL009598-PA [Aedes aegypti]